MKELLSEEESSEYITGELAQTDTGITPKTGWKTSQGQMTAVFIVVAMIASAFGFHEWSPERVQNVYEAVVTLATVLGPLLALVPVLKSYISSRGKIQSNTLWANAHVLASNNSSTMSPDLTTSAARGIKIGGLDTKVLGTALKIGAAVVPNKKVHAILDDAGEIVGLVDLVAGKFQKVGPWESNTTK